MKHHKILNSSVIALLFATPSLYAQKVWEENGKGFVMMEAEDTESSLGSCWKLTKPNGHTGKGALEMTCNNPSTGSPKQPLNYKFKITTPGEYSLHLHIYKNLQGQPHDKCNDVYIRVAGDFSAGSGAPSLDILKKDTKHFGGNHERCAWTGAKPIDSDHKKFAATYVFKAGETYTLTMSGRAQRANVNALVFTTAAAKSDALGSGGTTGLRISPVNGREATPRIVVGRGAHGLTLMTVDGRMATTGQAAGAANGFNADKSALGVYLNAPEQP